MKYLSRDKVYKRIEPFKTAKKIYIFCEGKKELDYFKFFQGFTSNLDIIAIPNEDGKSDPIKLKELAESSIDKNTVMLSQEFLDEIWFVIDTDRWNEGNKILDLRHFVEKQRKYYKGWYIAQSNPAFEIWLYYHFYSEKPKFEEIVNFTSFKDFVTTRIKGGFDNRKMPLEIQKASLNAENNFESKNGQPEVYSTEVFTLANQIISFIKRQLDQCLIK
jgi:hypothetical protein